MDLSINAFVVILAQNDENNAGFNNCLSNEKYLCSKIPE